jgi:excisionase family DNA binding protein
MRTTMGTETAEASDDRYVPIGDAAAATGVPRRTIYRWRADGSVPSREVGGQVLVNLVAVKVLAAARRKPAPAAIPPPVEMLKTVSRASDPTEDGELAAKAFELFAARKSPVEVVQALRLPPRAVGALFREYDSLLVPAAPSAPDYDQRLAAIEANHAELQGDVRTKVDLVNRLEFNSIATQSLRQAMEEVRRRLALLEQAPR